MVTEVVKEGRMVFMNHYKLLEGEEVTIDYGHKPNVRSRFLFFFFFSLSFHSFRRVLTKGIFLVALQILRFPLRLRRMHRLRFFGGQ